MQKLITCKKIILYHSTDFLWKKYYSNILSGLLTILYTSWTITAAVLFLCCLQDAGALTNALLWAMAIPGVYPLHNQMVMCLGRNFPLVSVFWKFLCRKSFLLDFTPPPAIVLHWHRLPQITCFSTISLAKNSFLFKSKALIAHFSNILHHLYSWQFSKSMKILFLFLTHVLQWTSHNAHSNTKFIRR
jgi:hypothetical protein